MMRLVCAVLLSVLPARGFAAGLAGCDTDAKFEDAIKRAAVDIKGKVLWGSTGGGTFKGNADYWDVDGWGSLTVKAGIKPSDALSDLFKPYGSAKYQVDCGCAVQIVMYKAIMDTITPAKFDDLFKSKDDGFFIATTFGLGSGKACPSGIKPYLQENGVEGKAADPVFLASLTPGILVAFHNPGAPAPWNIENAVFLDSVVGDRMYFAHPFGIVSEPALLGKLDAAKTGPGVVTLDQATFCVSSKLSALAP